MLVDARGISLSLVASGANTHDVKLLEATLDARVAQPDEATHEEQHLCADAAYAGQPAQRAIEQRGFVRAVQRTVGFWNGLRLEYLSSSGEKVFSSMRRLFTRPLSIEYYAAYLVLGSLK